jgi:hypothetical protein
LNSQLKTKILISEGHFYTKEDLRDRLHRFKMLSNRSQGGLHFYLYKDLSLKDFWIVGPWKNPHNFMFFYLGKKKLVKPPTTFSKEFGQWMQSMTGQFWNLIYPENLSNLDPLQNNFEQVQNTALVLFSDIEEIWKQK